MVIRIQIVDEAGPAFTHQGRDSGVAGRLVGELIRIVAQAGRVVEDESDLDVVRDALVDGRAVGDDVEAVGVARHGGVGPGLVGVAAAGKEGPVGGEGGGALVLQADGGVGAAGEGGGEALGRDVWVQLCDFRDGGVVRAEGGDVGVELGIGVDARGAEGGAFVRVGADEDGGFCKLASRELDGAKFAVEIAVNGGKEVVRGRDVEGGVESGEWGLSQAGQ